MSCSVCSHEFDFHARCPRSLRCGHTYCSSCLGILIEWPESGAPCITCPNDRVKTALPGDVMPNSPAACEIRINLLPKNFELLAMLGLSSNATTSRGAVCEACEDPHAPTHLCKDCDEYFCESKYREHLRRGPTKNHIVVQTDALAANTPLDPRCLEHNQAIVSFDVKCNRGVCARCLPQHNGHGFQQLDDLAAKWRKDLPDWLKRGKTILGDLTNAKQRVVQTESELIAKCDAVEITIQEHFKTLHRVLDERQAELLSRVKALRKSQQFSLVDQARCLEITHGSIKRAIDAAQSLPNTSTPAHVVHVLADVSRALSQRCKTDPIENGHVTVVCDECSGRVWRSGKVMMRTTCS
eukprot:c12901_g1_i1.p1 GENE.c12901_g1_i1~~c12901_g1_i1.p1  ORF type:complete len:354 (+),score=53.78 c12901_g1_i1:51-1112(+)